VISIRPGPAGGRNSATAARSAALSKISSHGVANMARTACTDAAGSRAIRAGVLGLYRSSPGPLPDG
jgi:hypothetical protein